MALELLGLISDEREDLGNGHTKVSLSFETEIEANEARSLLLEGNNLEEYLGSGVHVVPDPVTNDFVLLPVLTPGSVFVIVVVIR